MHITSTQIEAAPKNHRGILLGLFIIMLILQFSAVSIRSFWEDEALTAQLVLTDVSTIIENRNKNNHPPLYWIAVFSWGKVFGQNELGLKSFSIFWWSLAYLLATKISGDMFGKQVGITAAVLLTFSPFALSYAHNARYYSMAATLALLVFLAVQNYLETEKARYLLLYVISGATLLYTMYMGSVILLAINIIWLVYWARGRRSLTDFFYWAVTQFATIILFLPWISKLSGAYYRNIPAQEYQINWLAEAALRIGYLVYGFAVGEFFSPLNPITWFGIALTTGIILFALFKGRGELWFPITILIVFTIVSIWINLVAKFPQSAWQNLPHRSFLIYPFFIMVLAYGISLLKEKWRWAAILMLLLVYSAGILNYFTNREVVKPILIVPWQEIMETIEVEADVDFLVICLKGDFACGYYVERYKLPTAAQADWAEAGAHEIWLIQTNVSNFQWFEAANTETRTEIESQYVLAEILNYAPQGEEIARLKLDLLGYESYQYRVQVYRYVLP